jgi:hypothetical protein
VRLSGSDRQRASVESARSPRRGRLRDRRLPAGAAEEARTVAAARFMIIRRVTV